MGINWQGMSRIQQPQIIANLPAAQGGGDDGIGELFSGLQGLVGGLTHMASPAAATVTSSELLNK